MAADALIIGAGASGLAAALELARAGLRVEIIEARNRVGGRIFTKHDPALDHAIDLGAEFVHGMSPEIWVPAQRHNLKMTELEGDLWCSLDGKLQPCNFFGKADEILSAMNDREPDESFLHFLARKFPGNDHADAKRWATGYVSGFNAADPAEVSVHWLAHSSEAEERIEGERAFRIAGGYEKLIDIFVAALNALDVRIRLNTIVREIAWSAASAIIHASSSAGDVQLTAPRALITLPLGVLQSASVRFDPELPPPKQIALERLAMGKVVRVTLCFRERFWEELKPEGARKSMANLSFLFSRDDLFPTWWTQMPDTAPIITGWAPAHSAEQFAGTSDEQVIDQALESLSALLSVQKTHIQSQLNAFYFHSWDSDPYSRGAYSYVKAGGEGCQKVLGAPIGGTLFFAGEATDITGNNGTVHGAIASGLRAANEILGATARAEG